MIPGQYRVADGEIELNAGKATISIAVVNTGDRPVQVGSHFHFFEVNRGLSLERERAFGMRLNIPAGTAVRFEPGEEKVVELVELGGAKLSFGLNGLSKGLAMQSEMPADVVARLQTWLRGALHG